MQMKKKVDWLPSTESGPLRKRSEQRSVTLQIDTVECAVCGWQVGEMKQRAKLKEIDVEWKGSVESECVVAGGPITFVSVRRNCALRVGKLRLLTVHLRVFFFFLSGCIF